MTLKTSQILNDRFSKLNLIKITMILKTSQIPKTIQLLKFNLSKKKMTLSEIHLIKIKMILLHQIQKQRITKRHSITIKLKHQEEYIYLVYYGG